jgi:NAD(P)H-hydrate epimerase
MTGSGCLSSRAALRTGSGLVYYVVPDALRDIVEIKLTEVISIPVADRDTGRFLPASADDILSAASGCDAAAVGPGVGRSPETAALINDLVSRLEIPMVVDADGFAITAPETLAARKPPVVITPHPGEMAAWLGRSVSDIQSAREETATEVAGAYGVITVLKGHRTVVADHARIYVNQTGNPGMATAGAGDVLTGMIASLIGQGMPLFEAAVLGVRLHGEAGDAAAQKQGVHGLIASDIICALPGVLRNHAE